MFEIIRIMSRGNLLSNSLSIIFWCFCSDGRQVRLVSFFVSSLFVPDAERAIVLAWRGMLTVRVTHGAERGPHAGLVIELCTEGLGGEQVQKVWDQLVESVTQ